MAVLAVIIVASVALAATILIQQQAGETPVQKASMLSFDFSISEEEYNVTRDFEWSAKGFTLRVVEAGFRSIIWNNTPWTHKLIYLEPQPANSSLILVVAGGLGPGNATSNTLKYITEASAASGVPVAVLTGLPNTPPGVDGELLLAISNAEALRTGDPTRSLVYPMAQAYIKAMSLIERISSVSPSGFVVSGGCMRGWTAWVVARHDPRVVAIVPRSFNVVRITDSFHAHVDVYGQCRGPIHMLEEQLGTLENFEELPGYENFMVEYNPVDFVSKVGGKPILVLMGANDCLFPPGLEEAYTQLHPDFHVVYMPNTTHMGLHALKETWTTIMAFVKHVEDGRRWPELTAKITKSDGGITVDVTYGETPEALYLVYAEPTRIGSQYAEFSQSRWAWVKLSPDSPTYTLKVEKPLGVYILAVYSYGKLKFIATTQITTIKP